MTGLPLQLRCQLVWQAQLLLYGLRAARHLLQPRRNRGLSGLCAARWRQGKVVDELRKSGCTPGRTLARCAGPCVAGLPKMVLGRDAKNKHLGPGATYDNIRYVRGEFCDALYWRRPIK